MQEKTNVTLTVYVTPEPMQVIYVGDAIDAYVEWSPSPLNIHGYNVFINWGDGATLTLPQYASSPATSPTHTYVTEGTYTLRAIVTNSDTGEFGTGQIPVTVKPLPTGTVQLLVWPEPNMQYKGYTVPAMSEFSYPYAAGSLVSLVATAYIGYKFLYWIIDNLTTDLSNPLTLLMNHDRRVDPIFIEDVVPPNRYVLTINGAVGGTTDPPDGSYNYIGNTSFPVTAIPDTDGGYEFYHWLLDGVNIGSNPSIVILFDADHTLTPMFRYAGPGGYTLNILPSAGGITSPASGSYPTAAGATVKVNALADQKHLFDKWLLDGVEHDTPYPAIIDVYMDGDHTVAPVFTVNPAATFMLSVDSAPFKAAFTLNGVAQQAPYSASLTTGNYAVAMPPTVDVEGVTYAFQRWSDGSTNPSRTVSLVADTALIATYAVGEAPFDWMQWLTQYWYIPAGVGVGVLVLVVLWPRQQPVIVLSERKKH